jgi:hypothetical protein
MLTVSCHCGKVTLELPRAPRALTQCNCSICRRYGALWAYFRRSSVRVRAARGSLVSYSWRNKVREFRHCRFCGCVTHYQQRVKKRDGSDTLAVNLRNVDQPGLIATVPIKLLDGAASWKFLEHRPQPFLLRSPTERPRGATRDEGDGVHRPPDAPRVARSQVRC